ncbi:MAG: PmoA family protein [Planctomycetota bacterium]
MPKLRLFACCSLLLGAVAIRAAEPESKSYTVTVSAGEHDRSDTPVCIVLPEAPQSGWTMSDEAGTAVPVQQDAQRQLWFILPELKAGQSKTYALKPSKAAEAAPAVNAIQNGNVVELTVDNRTVLHYQADKSELPKGYGAQYQRGGYIQSVFTPAGRLVTDDYPPNHKHHHGIWTPWTKTEFEGRHPDFWNMGDKTGTVEWVALDKPWAGTVFGGFKSRHKQVDLTAKPEPKTALNETWEVRVFRVGLGAQKYNLFDLTDTQECASASPLSLLKYHYGGFGIRGNREWDGAPNAFFLTSEGKDRKNGNESRARWSHIGGKVGGELAGIAVLDHPDNFRAPQPLRIHPTEPFLGICASQLGDWKIEPGKPYVARYRLVVSDGPADKELLERLWNDFAKPPGVVLKPQMNADERR